MDVERATAADLPAIEALLGDAGLPLIGVPAAFLTGVVARDDDGLAGAAAVEPYGTSALLRSVVVGASHRGTGVGQALVTSAEDVARALGAQEIYLLTETAQAWFERRGYASLERSGLPDVIRASDEVRVACAETAVAMRRSL